MEDVQNILSRADSLDISKEVNGYSGVAIYAGQDDEGKDIVYTAGNQDGIVLEISNDWGTQEQADRIFAQIQGFKYQGYSASGAMLDPAAEIGDGVAVSDVYSGIFIKATSFGRLMPSDIGAPYQQEVEHEFKVETPTERQYTRFTKSVRAALSITATQIAAEVKARTKADEGLSSRIEVNATNILAKVSRESQNSSKTFGWKLLPDSWEIFSENGTVLNATRSGLEVIGTIKADKGYIGGEDGFTITAKKIYNNISSMNGTQEKGIYIGTNGIKLGQNFKVDSAGNLYAESGTFNGEIKAKNIKYGGDNGTVSGSAITSGSVGTTRLTSGVNTSLEHANVFGKVTDPNTVDKVEWFRANLITCDAINAVNYKTPKAGDASFQKVTFMDGTGTAKTRWFLVV